MALSVNTQRYGFETGSPVIQSGAEFTLAEDNLKLLRFSFLRQSLK